MGPVAHTSESPKTAPDLLNGLPPEEYRFGSKSSGLGSLLHKVRRNFQDYGWWTTARKTVAYLLRSVYFRQVFRLYRIDLAAVTPSQELENPVFKFKTLTEQDVEWIGQIENMAEWLSGQLRNEIAAGQLCLVALNGDEVAGFNLIRLDYANLPLVNLKKGLHRGCAWSEHIAVKRNFRRAGLGSQLRLRIFEELRQRGYRRLYGGTLRSNAASLSLARSLGFKEIGDIHYRTIFSFKKWWYTRVRK